MGQTCDDSFLSLMEEKIWKYIMLLILLEWETCHTKTLIAYKSYLTLGLPAQNEISKISKLMT